MAPILTLTPRRAVCQDGAAMTQRNAPVRLPVRGLGRAAPGIRYATAADGVCIAYWALGQGRPLVSVPSIPFSHIGMEYEDSTYYHWYSRLAGRTTLVRYDNRNSGLSD